MSFKRLILPACLALGLALLGRPASADLSFHVSLDTSTLNPLATYYTEFSLSDGHVVSLGTPDTNNNVVFSNFTFGGGAFGASLPDIGNASGSTASSVTLADGDAGGVADHAQAFTPGSVLGFDVTTTTNMDAGGFPDVLSFFLFDSSFNYITTNAPADTPNAFLRLDLTGPGITRTDVKTYGNTAIPLGPPVVSDTMTPEPGTVALGISVSLCGALTALRRRRHAKKR